MWSDVSDLIVHKRRNGYDAFPDPETVRVLYTEAMRPSNINTLVYLCLDTYI